MEKVNRYQVCDGDGSLLAGLSLLLVGFADDPCEEIANVFAVFGEHAYGYHVEHLYGLVESHV